MRGSVHIKVGRYQLDERVWLTVHASDDGTVVSVEDGRMNSRYAAAINQHGTVAWRQVDQQSTLPAQAPITDIDPETPITLRGRSTRRKATRIKFIIQYGPKSRPRNVAFVLGGFTDGDYVRVLFRVSGGLNTWDDQLSITLDHIDDDDQAVTRQADPLPESRWEEFMALPEHATFTLTKAWRKMSVEELRTLLDGQTIRHPPPETGG